ncbi:hypothetical protein [Komagataeibacter kakiaceti]
MKRDVEIAAIALLGDAFFLVAADNITAPDSQYHVAVGAFLFSGIKKHNDISLSGIGNIGDFFHARRIIHGKRGLTFVQNQLAIPTIKMPSEHLRGGMCCSAGKKNSDKDRHIFHFKYHQNKQSAYLRYIEKFVNH